jgi:CheY-like chemotaxis protein/anti-sigma regulatory factor (Ser/Thr protein kinase)
VTTDEKRLRQILINLLSNALKYTDNGSVSLTLKYRSQVAEFTIKDTGEGIAEENIERIFRPFERIRTPGQSRTGTGLGLTITRLLTEIMGGDLSVESTPGEGSTFRVSLMLSSLHTSRPESMTSPARRIYGYKGPRRKIMVVDDESSHRQVIRAMLAPLGFEIVDIGNSLAVVDAIDNSHPDLLLLDVSMPGCSGWDILTQLRSNNHQVPVVMVSADASEGRNRLESPTLHNGYIIKPVRLNLLLDHIARLLNLDWRFEKSPEPLAATTTPESETLILPADEHRAALVGLATIGHKKGLLEALHGLHYRSEADPVFVEELVKLTNDFQFEKIIDLIKVTEHEHT